LLLVHLEVLTQAPGHFKNDYNTITRLSQLCAKRTSLISVAQYER